jgi:XRE family transcriptional regulator, regulator of sulfur utilization
MEKLKEDAKVLLGRRIRSLRTMKGWTQQELGEYADVNYKFVGAIERGQQNPSFAVLVKIAAALGVELQELFRFEQDTMDRKDVEDQINAIIQSLPDADLGRMLSVLRVLYPVG